MRATAALLVGVFVLHSTGARAQDHHEHSAPHSAGGSHSAHAHSGHGDVGSAAEPAVASLIEQVRAATAHLHDRDAAPRAGYRRVGPDFPAMGEHWVSPGLLLHRGLNYSAPAILTYTQINGRPALTGVVFTVGLGPGESPPPVAGAERPWHEHNGSIADESLVRPASGPVRQDSRRLAVLHLWTEVPNPAGPFATENWALPFARLGFPVPEPVPPGAARALSLVLSGEGYFADLVAASGGAEALAAAQSIIAEARADVLAVIGRSPQGEQLGAEVLTSLEAVWARLTGRIADACGVCVGPLRDR